MALAKNTFGATTFSCDINGKRAGFLVSFDPPSMEVDKIDSALGPDLIKKQALGNLQYGDAKASFNPAHSKPWMEVIDSVFNKACTEFEFRADLADHNFKSKRAVIMGGCLIKKVTLGKLAAGDGKKHWDISMEWEGEKVTFEKGDDKVLSGIIAAKEKGWLCSNFEPSGFPGGIDPASFIDIDCGSMTAKVGTEHVGMFRNGTKHYTGYEVGGLKTTNSSIAYEAALAYVNKVMQDGAIDDSEYIDCGCAIKDMTMKKTLGEITWKGVACQKFTWAPQLKSGGDTMSNFSIDYVVEQLLFTPTHVA